MNQQITNLDMFEFIGRQALQNDLLKKENEQLKAMLQQAQNGIIEAQEVARKLHQTQKSAIESNGTEVKQLEKETS